MKRKDILFLSILTFIVAAVWISSNLYHAWVDSTITEELQIRINPIDPNFDTTTIEMLKTRKKVTPVYTLDVASTTPTPTVPTQISPTPDIPSLTIQQALPSVDDQLPTLPVENVIVEP